MQSVYYNKYLKYKKKYNGLKESMKGGGEWFFNLFKTETIAEKQIRESQEKINNAIKNIKSNMEINTRTQSKVTDNTSRLQLGISSFIEKNNTRDVYDFYIKILEDTDFIDNITMSDYIFFKLIKKFLYDIKEKEKFIELIEKYKSIKKYTNNTEIKQICERNIKLHSNILIDKDKDKDQKVRKEIESIITEFCKTL